MADESDDEFAVGGTGTLHATGMSTLGALKGKKVKEMQSDVKPPSQKKSNANETGRERRCARGIL